MLGIDPGAKRLGWAIVDDAGDDYTLVASGVVVLEQATEEPWSLYRRRLITWWVREFPLAEWCLPHGGFDIVSFELQPPFGMSGVQQQLAKTVRDCIQTLCESHRYMWSEFGANSIKKKLTGSGKATKVGVRDAVIGVFSHLESRKKELTTVSEESDAIGIALVGLGYQV